MGAVGTLLAGDTGASVLHLGFLPSRFHVCLDKDSRLAWQGHAIGNRIIVPALDEGGAVIDFCALRGDRATPSVYEHPQGLINTIQYGGKISLMTPSQIGMKRTIAMPDWAGGRSAVQAQRGAA